MGDRLNGCWHESAHGVARQLLIGDLNEMGFRKGAAYSYPHERKPFAEMDRDHLAKLAVVIGAGIAAETKLCIAVGTVKEYAIADDERQLGACQKYGGFSDEEMDQFQIEAERLVENNEPLIRKIATEMNRRNKLSGEKVTSLMEQHTPSKT